MRSFAASVRATSSSSTLAQASRLLEAGFERLVLEDPLYRVSWEALRAWLPHECVAAIRLYLPYPKTIRLGATSPFRLGATHPAAKSDALKQAERTLQVADDYSIPRVLLPVARVDRSTAERFRRGEPRDRSRDEDPLFRKTFDSYRSTVYRLLELADRYTVTLCMTPTCREDEIPGGEELESCLREFAGAPLGIWLDTVRLPLGLDILELDNDEKETEGAHDYQKKAGKVTRPSRRPPIEGASVHDYRGDTTGLCPRTGELDWERLERPLRNCPLWSLDLREGCPPSEIVEGREFILGLEGGPGASSSSFTIPY